MNKGITFAIGALGLATIIALAVPWWTNTHLPPPNIPVEEQLNILDPNDANLPAYDLSSALSSTPPQNTARPTYAQFLDTVKTKREALSTKPQARATLLHDLIHNDMVSYWDTTTWDFNGVSRIAGEGEIACGYFVTTILQDLGFEIDRIRLSQAVSATMIRELTKNIIILHSVDDVIAYIKTQPSPAIYIVGLDFHTGFISSNADGIFFIHSNYINREGVVKELAANSAALAQSNYFMLGNLTTNEDLLAKWVKG